MDVLSRLKLLNAFTALTPPAVFPVRSFTAREICVHEPVQGLNLLLFVCHVFQQSLVSSQFYLID